MKFGPSFHEALLALRETPSDQLRWLHSINGDVLLIIRVEVRKMVRRVRLGEHSNDDSEEAAQFGHRMILIHSCRCAKGGVRSRCNPAGLTAGGEIC